MQRIAKALGLSAIAVAMVLGPIASTPAKANGPGTTTAFLTVTRPSKSFINVSWTANTTGWVGGHNVDTSIAAQLQVNQVQVGSDSRDYPGASYGTLPTHYQSFCIPSGIVDLYAQGSGAIDSKGNTGTSSDHQSYTVNYQP